jgi:hypothetical protein
VATGNILPGTVHQYGSDLRAKVIPRIGRIALTDLKAKHLCRMDGDLLESGGRSGKPLAAKSVRNYGTTLRRALQDAVEDDLLKSNPTAAVNLPRARESKIETWKPAQTRAVLDELAEPLRSMVSQRKSWRNVSAIPQWRPRWIGIRTSRRSRTAPQRWR